MYTFLSHAVVEDCPVLWTRLRQFHKCPGTKRNQFVKGPQMFYVFTLRKLESFPCGTGKKIKAKQTQTFCLAQPFALEAQRVRFSSGCCWTRRLRRCEPASGLKGSRFLLESGVTHNLVPILLKKKSKPQQHLGRGTYYEGKTSQFRWRCFSPPKLRNVNRVYAS